MLKLRKKQFISIDNCFFLIAMVVIFALLPSVFM